MLDTSYAEEDYAIGMAKGSSLEAAVNAALEELDVYKRQVFSWYVQYSIIASSDCQEEYHSF